MHLLHEPAVALLAFGHQSGGAVLPDEIRPNQAANQALQARLYTAFFQEVWPEPWLAGALLWKVHPPSDRAYAGAFTPQDKPAEAVMRWAMGGPAPCMDSIR